jgi:hypothetical protein
MLFGGNKQQPVPQQGVDPNVANAFKELSGVIVDLKGQIDNINARLGGSVTQQLPQPQPKIGNVVKEQVVQNNESEENMLGMPIMTVLVKFFKGESDFHNTTKDLIYHREKGDKIITDLLNGLDQNGLQAKKDFVEGITSYMPMVGGGKEVNEIQIRLSLLIDYYLLFPVYSRVYDYVNSKMTPKTITSILIEMALEDDIIDSWTVSLDEDLSNKTTKVRDNLNIFFPENMDKIDAMILDYSEIEFEQDEIEDDNHVDEDEKVVEEEKIVDNSKKGKGKK